MFNPWRQWINHVAHLSQDEQRSGQSEGCQLLSSMTPLTKSPDKPSEGKNPSHIASLKSFWNMITPNMFQLEHRHLTHWVSLFKTLSKTFLLASHHVTRSNTIRWHLVALDNCNHIRVPLLIVRLCILNLTMYSIVSRPTKQKPLIYLCLRAYFPSPLQG
jgi:hypothetical protein